MRFLALINCIGAGMAVGMATNGGPNPAALFVLAVVFVVFAFIAWSEARRA